MIYKTASCHWIPSPLTKSCTLQLLKMHTNYLNIIYGATPILSSSNENPSASPNLSQSWSNSNSLSAQHSKAEVCEKNAQLTPEEAKGDAYMVSGSFLQEVRAQITCVPYCELSGSTGSRFELVEVFDANDPETSHVSRWE